MFLGSLILIFGIINLFEGSLIIASLISILIGGGTIYYSFKKFKKSKWNIQILEGTSEKDKE